MLARRAASPAAEGADVERWVAGALPSLGAGDGEMFRDTGDDVMSIVDAGDVCPAVVDDDEAGSSGDGERLTVGTVIVDAGDDGGAGSVLVGIQLFDGDMALMM